MNKKRFTAIFSLALLLIFALSVQVFALDYSSPYHASKWQDDGNTTIYGSYGGAYNDVTYVYNSWSRATSIKFNENCFYFARLVTHKTKHVDFNLQTDSRRAIYLYGGHVKGVDELYGKNVNDIAKLLCQYLYAPSVSQVENAFSNVKPGDVIQFVGWSHRTQHTMVVAAVYSDGFETLEGNNPNGTVKNGSYTFSEFRNMIANAGYAGGFSIYRFGLETVRMPDITDVPSKSLVAGYYFSYQCRADGDVNSWGTSAGSIPYGMESYSQAAFTPGLSINSSTGLISGIPSHTQQGKTSYMPIRYYFNVTASNSGGTDQEAAFIAVYEPPVITTNEKLANGSVGSYYEQEIYAEGTEWTMDWEKKSGMLPPGLNLSYTKSAGSRRKAKISGTPTQRGTYTFEIKCSNLVGNPETTTTKTFTITIAGEYSEPNIWINYTLKNGKVGDYYSDWLGIGYSSIMYLSRVVDSNAHVDVADGSLPPGLALSHSGSYIYLKGTPTTAGTYPFTLKLTDCYGGYTQKTLTVTIESNGGGTEYEDSSMSIRYYFLKGKLGVSYRDYIIVNGGTSPYQVKKIMGSIPSGLSLSVSGRYIYLSGLPLQSGTYSFILRVTGSHNGYVDQTFSLNIASNSSYESGGAGNDDEPSKPKIITTKLPDAAMNSEWSAIFEASGTQPITWKTEGDGLPEGFTITENGTISGIATEAGKYKFTVTAENSEGTASKKFTLKVVPQKPSITTMSLPNGIKDIPYIGEINASGTAPIKFSKSGKFPKGLKLDKNTGEITGTPTKDGTFNFKIKAKNKGGKDTVSLQIVIEPEEVDKDLTVQDKVFTTSFIPVDDNSENENLNDLYVITQDEELYGDVEVLEGSPLTLGFDEWTDEFGDDVEVSDVKVFVNGEELQGLEISEAGTFTLPVELVNGEFSVYVSAKSGDIDFKTSEVNITAQAQDENSSFEENPSGACNIDLSGLALITLCGALFFRKR